VEKKMGGGSKDQSGGGETNPRRKLSVPAEGENILMTAESKSQNGDWLFDQGRRPTGEAKGEGGRRIWGGLTDIEGGLSGKNLNSNLSHKGGKRDLNRFQGIHCGPEKKKKKKQER